MVSDVLYTEWQGRSCTYAIRLAGAKSSLSKTIFKTYREVRGLHQRLSKDDTLKPLLPAFPTRRYIINGSTKRVEYRRLTLDYFMQNLLLTDAFARSMLVLHFFGLSRHAGLGTYASTIVGIPKSRLHRPVTRLDVLLPNKQAMQVEVDGATEAVEVCELISEQLKLHYFKDKRLVLFQRQKVLKVLDDNERVLKVLDNFAGTNKIGKMYTTKVKHGTAETAALGKFLGMKNDD